MQISFISPDLHLIYVFTAYQHVCGREVENTFGICLNRLFVP